jgi:hypothetical protein
MVSIICIGVVVALAVLAILAKTYLAAPKKAEKWEKGEILKQLLELSERENNISGIAPSRSRTPLKNQRMRPGLRPKPGGKASQPMRSNNAGC